MANIKNSRILYPSRNGISRGYDIIGNIAIVKFDRKDRLRDKKIFAERFLKGHKNVRTVLEKSEKIKGRLRVQKTKFLLGEKTKEALYRENGCIFRLNVDTCYFSPRLSSERKEIAGRVKKGEKVLVMFGGTGVYGIVIAKLSKVLRVVSIEIGRECCKYARDNVKRNKAENVEIIQGDVRKKILKEKFDRIVMPRPNLKDSFLDIAFKRIKKNGVIYYYGFYNEKDRDKLSKLILDEAKKAGKKVRIFKIKESGEIGMKKFRYRADIRVLN